MNKIFIIFLMLFIPLSQIQSSEFDFQTSGLDAKLYSVFKRYEEAAKKLFISNIDGIKIERTEWEKWVKNYFSKNDLIKLKINQKKRILTAQISNKQKSFLDLDKLRSDPKKLKHFIKEMPKGGLLHIHPSGCDSKMTLEKILKEKNPKINPEKFLKNATGYSLFNEATFRKDFLDKLQKTYDTLSNYLKTKIKPELEEYIENKSLPYLLKKQIVEKLNAIIEKEPLWNKVVLDRKKLKEETKKLIKESSLDRKKLIRTNVLILENYYPHEIKNSLRFKYFYKKELEFLKKKKHCFYYNDLTKKEQDEFLALFFLPKGNHDFKTFLARFYPRHSLGKSSFYRYKAFLTQQRAQGISYVEFTSGIFFRKDTFLKQLEEYNLLAKKLEDETGVVVRILFAFSRWKDIYENKMIAYQLSKLIDNFPYIIGVNIVGSELEYPLFEQGQFIYSSLKNAIQSGANINLTVHAGEHEPNNKTKNCRDALIFGVQRIGHAVWLNQDPVALEFAIKNKIAIEANIISNLRLKAVQSTENHPFLKFLRLDLPVSLSTDDPGIFKTSIEDEYYVAITKTDISWFEVKQLILNSIKTAFVNKNLKRHLLTKLKDDLFSFENKWKKILD